MSTETNTAKTLRLSELEKDVKAGRNGEPEGPVAVEDLEKLATSLDVTDKRRRAMVVLLLAATLVLIGGGYFIWSVFQYENAGLPALLKKSQCSSGDSSGPASSSRMLMFAPKLSATPHGLD